LIPIFLDTHYVVASINPKDQHHQKAREWAARIGDRPLLTTESVIQEIGNSLARKHRKTAVDVIDLLRASQEITVITVDTVLLNRGLNLYRTVMDQDWGLIDCISFVVMRERGTTDALTYDHYFVQAGFNALMRAG